MGSSLLRLNSSVSSDAYVVSDADRNVIAFVSSGVVTKVPTGDHSRPNRAAEDNAGFVHVTLRGTGEIAMLDPSGEIVARNQVCAAPRGVAVDRARNELVLACAEGQLVRHSVDAANYTALRRIVTDPDVRDVVVQNDRIYVSRFRSAQILEFTGDTLTKRHVLPTITLSNNGVATEREGSRFAPSVAWKMVESPEGDGVVVLHQRALLDEVGAVDPVNTDGATQGGGSSYGGSSPEFGCSSIVQPAVSEVRSDGSVVTSDSIGGVVLAVDLVVGPNEFSRQFRDISVASAGQRDPEAPRSTIVRAAGSDNGEPNVLAPDTPFAPSSGVFDGSIMLHGADEVLPNGDIQVQCTQLAASFESEPSDGVVTGIARTSTGSVAFLRRNPALLSFNDSRPATLLADDSVRDTGHDLFHRDSGGGIACASCHPEATDDGHVWNFADIGIRKTQFLGIPLADTAPFHWDGSLPNLGSLMDEVFVGRMGGVFQSEARLGALNTWMSTREPLGKRQADAAAEARGRALFESKETQCSTCHSGPAFTDNNSYIVGTSSEKLQVPSLVGLVLHPPYMHNGCAQTIKERFSAACGGGEAHGMVSHLNDAQIDDLVAYLASL